MITLIGTSTTIIGFGLCGIDHAIEISENESIERIQRIIDTSSSEIIMLSERFVEHIEGGADRILIPIPDRHEKEPIDRLERLVRDVIGTGGSY